MANGGGVVLGAQGVAEIEMCLRIVGQQAQRLAQAGDRLTEPILRGPDRTQVIVRERVARSDPDGRGVAVGRGVEFTLSLQGAAQVEVARSCSGRSCSA